MNCHVISRRAIACLSKRAPSSLSYKTKITLSQPETKKIFAQQFCRIGDSMQVENYLRACVPNVLKFTMNQISYGDSDSKSSQDLKSRISNAQTTEEVMDLLDENASKDDMLLLILAMSAKYSQQNGGGISHWSYMPMLFSEDRQAFLSHEKHPLWERKLEALVADTDSWMTLSALYAFLGNIGQPLTSYVMQNIFCKLSRSMEVMDLDAACNFISGYISCDLESDIVLYNRKLKALTRIMAKFVWR